MSSDWPLWGPARPCRTNCSKETIGREDGCPSSRRRLDGASPVRRRPDATPLGQASHVVADTVVSIGIRRCFVRGLSAPGPDVERMPAHARARGGSDQVVIFRPTYTCAIGPAPTTPVNGARTLCGMTPLPHTSIQTGEPKTFWIRQRAERAGLHYAATAKADSIGD